jgi:tetratricopeptide (TPR) repeat protein
VPRDKQSLAVPARARKSGPKPGAGRAGRSTTAGAPLSPEPSGRSPSSGERLRRSRPAAAPASGSSTSPVFARRVLIALGALLIVALLIGGIGARLRRRSTPTAAAPRWDRPESAEEARLLQAALAQPRDAAAQTALGQHYLAARRPFEAVWAFQQARSAANAGTRAADAQPPTSNLTLALADALEAGGLWTRALDLVSEAAARSPGDAALSTRRAELQIHLGRPGAAVATLRALAERPSNPQPPTVDAGLLLGRALEAAGDEPAAAAQYRRCLAANPDSAAAHMRLGRLLAREGQVAEGRRHLGVAHRLAPTDPEPAYMLGESFLPGIRSDPDPARRWFMAALAAAPRYAPAQVALGQMGLTLKRTGLAARHFAAALRVDPWDAEALLGLAAALAALGHPAEAHERRGEGLIAQGKLPQALAEFRALQAAQPWNPAAPLLISQALTEMQQNAAAAIEIRRAIARYPQDGQIKERLVELYILSHSLDAARRVCEEWQQSDPTAAKPHWLLGRIALSGANETTRAIEEYERAARLAPNDPEVAGALGEALSRPGPRRDLNRALLLLGRAVELSPGEARYRYQLGLLLQQSDRAEPARRQFLRALDLDPNLTAGYTGLIQVAGALRAPDQIPLLASVVREQQAAERRMTELHQRAYRTPADPAGYAALARALADQGDVKAARAQWDVVLTLQPGDATARRERSRLDQILGVL